MKFGSVNFFKHLIYSTVICVVVFAAAFSMIFGIKASSESIRVSDKLPERLPDDLSDPAAPAMSDEADTNTDDLNLKTDISEAGSSEPISEDSEMNTSDVGSVTIPDNAAVEDIYGALTEIGISSKDIIDYIYENDSEYLDELISKEAEKASAEFLHTDAPAEDTPTPVDASADYYPQLYVNEADISLKTDGTICLSFESIVPDYLNDIFYILGKEDVSAVFFLTCDEAEKLSDKQLAAFAEKGCTLGISLTGTGSLEEMNKTFERILSATGISPNTYICDDISDELEEELDIRGFVRFGSKTVSGESWTEVYHAAQDSVGSSENGAFLRLDGGYYSVVTAEDIIDLLKSKEYTFITV